MSSKTQATINALSAVLKEFNFWGRVFLIQVKVGSHWVDRGLVRINNIEHAERLKDELSEQGFLDVRFRPPGTTYHRNTPIEDPIHPCLNPVTNFGPIPLLKA